MNNKCQELTGLIKAFPAWSCLQGRRHFLILCSTANNKSIPISKKKHERPKKCHYQGLTLWMIFLYADNYFYIQVQLLLPWALVHRVNNHTQPHVDKQTLLMVVTALHIKGSYGNLFLRWEYCVPDFGLRRSTCSPSRLPRPSRPPEQGPRPRRSHRRRGGRGSGGGRAGAPQWGRWRGW